MNQLKRAREATAPRLSYRKAAARIGVSLSTLYRYETGELSPTLETLERMRTAYGLSSLDELVGRVPQDGAA